MSIIPGEIQKHGVQQWEYEPEEPDNIDVEVLHHSKEINSLDQQLPQIEEVESSNNVFSTKLSPLSSFISRETAKLMNHVSAISSIYYEPSSMNYSGTSFAYRVFHSFYGILGFKLATRLDTLVSINGFPVRCYDFISPLQFPIKVEQDSHDQWELAPAYLSRRNIFLEQNKHYLVVINVVNEKQVIEVYFYKKK